MRLKILPPQRAASPASSPPLKLRHRRVGVAASLLAACTLTLFAVPSALSPGAMASTQATVRDSARVAQVSIHTDPGSSALGVKASPDISVVACTSASATWVHVELAVAGNAPTTICLGRTGTFIFAGNEAYSFCAGNNYGTLRYYVNGEAFSLGFSGGARESFNHKTSEFVSLTINGWSGNATC